MIGNSRIGNWCQIARFGQVVVAILMLGSVVTIADAALAQTQQPLTCPQELDSLASLLVRDLPSYANRELRSTIALDRAVPRSAVVLIAGQTEFEPLPLDAGADPPPATADPYQVFITTLERQYINDRAIEVQQYHWLFLTRSASGWRLVMMFTRYGSTQPNQPPSPPRETSQGAMARAVTTWLRDCRAGVIENEN